MKQIVRRASATKLVLLEHITAAGGGPNFYTARAYESADKITSLARCNIDGHIFSDLGQLDLDGKKLEKSHSEVYRLVDFLFPELINRGLKAEGYVKYSVPEVETTTIFKKA